MFEAPALEVRLELFVDEPGQRDSFGFEPFDKSREVLFDESVQGGLLRAVTFVRNWVAVEGKSRAGDHRSFAVMGVVFTMRSDSGVVIWHSVPWGVRHCLAVRAHGARTADAAIEAVNSRHNGCVQKIALLLGSCDVTKAIRMAERIEASTVQSGSGGDISCMS